MKNLQGSVVVVTGGSNGIGLAAARQFSAAGARVALIARRVETLSTALAQLPAESTLTATADVTNEADVARAFADITARWGHVDILLNNAGTGFATDLAKASVEDYRRILDTNVTGVFLCTRAVLPAMKTRKSGHIIAVSSAAGKNPNPNAPLYCASKAALNSYMSGLQQQVAAERIRVSLVSPSTVDTAYWDGRQVDRTKFLQPAEVADVILFIARQPDGVLIKDIDLAALR